MVSQLRVARAECEARRVEVERSAGKAAQAEAATRAAEVIAVVKAECRNAAAGTDDLRASTNASVQTVESLASAEARARTAETAAGKE